MTPELKTLKDIVSQKPRIRNHKKESVCAICLKQEAIKWVKHIENDKENWEGVNMRRHAWELNRWIIEFFNITEEDLK